MTVRFSKAIVVGGSSGIGEALAKRLADEGAQVAVLGRRAEELARVVQHNPAQLHAFVHDARDFDDAAPLFERVIQALGGLDTLVYAAGVLHPVAEGEYDFTNDREMVETNLLGAMAWMNLAAARFEAAGEGTLLGITSVAGERGRRANPAYCTTKAALNTFLEALRNRCSRSGVNVVTVKPGFVDTAMTRGLKGLFWLISPDEAALGALSLARQGNSASGFVPFQWRYLMWVIRLIPSFIFRRLNV